MRAPNGLLRKFANLALAGLALAASYPGSTQNVTPTPEQLQLLRSLPPEQQEALRRRLMGDSSATTGRQDNGTRNGEQSQGPTQRVDLTDEARAQLDRDRPYLQPGDSVIIEVDFHLPPPIVPSSPAGGVPQNAAQQVPQANQAGMPAAGAVNPQSPQQVPALPEKPELSAEEQERAQRLIDMIRNRNPYRLTPEGALQLPGFADIALAGLNQDQATLRLRSEREFRDLEVRVVRLPLDKAGTDALRPFGYDLFDQGPSTFAPLTDVPVPADYIVGPGDQLAVQLYGNDSRSLMLVVDRDGSIDFPQLGPLRVGGMRFNDAKAAIESRVQRQMTGVHANVAMSDVRSIRVFVAGDAKHPGSYTISGLGTVTSALYAAGGVKPTGSLRNIELKRQGKLVRKLDLYDLLLRGDTSDDSKLLPGDVVFIPPVGPIVTAYGEVQRPAIYELRGETTPQALIALAGGLSPQADADKASLTQIDESRRRRVVALPLDSSAPTGVSLRSGDVLFVPKLRPTLDSGVLVQGYVHAPGLFAFHEGLRLSDVIRSVDDLRPNADIHYLMVRRENPSDRRVSVFSADLARALASPGSAADIPLAARDRITVFDLESGRDRIIRPMLDELRLQSGFDRPTEVVRIEGRVKVPGEYPLEPGMKVSDLVRAGGGLEDAAYGGRAELARYQVQNGEARRADLVVVDLAGVLRGDAAADVRLEPFDSLSIKEVQDWGSQEQVTLVGEVRFPGKYSLKRGETLKSVLARAGGLNDHAFAEGTVFTRTELKDREQKQLDVLAERLQNDLATLALQGAAANQAQAAQALTVGQSLLAQVRSAKAVGRLVIDLPRAMRANTGSTDDLIMRDGDVLVIPKLPQEVTVIGEVQSPTSHLYRQELGRDDYISLSGGTTRKADKGAVYVVRADGSVLAHGGSRWFNSCTVNIKPGDTVVVPLDTERLPALPFWQAVTQILYNLSISAAAVNSF